MHRNLADLFELAAGRGASDAHLEECPRCAEALARARRILEAGRIAVGTPAPGRRAMRLAMAAFREARRAQPGRLRLLFDSVAEAAFAVREGAPRSRFLRFGPAESGAAGVEAGPTIEVEVTPGPRGLSLRGQVVPPAAAQEAVATAGEGAQAVVRRARVDGRGLFHLKGLPRGTVELRLGAVVATLDL